jgi:predicted amino acid dehydrogenase
MRRRGLLQGQWWPVGLKLAFHQMAAPDPEIMEATSYTSHTVQLIINMVFSDAQQLINIK